MEHTTLSQAHKFHANEMHTGNFMGYQNQAMRAPQKFQDMSAHTQHTHTETNTQRIRRLYVCQLLQIMVIIMQRQR